MNPLNDATGLNSVQRLILEEAVQFFPAITYGFIMDLLDQILPFYVEYLGCFERDKNENVLTALDALNVLLKSGVQKKVFIKNAELSFSDDYLILTNGDRVSKLFY